MPAYRWLARRQAELGDLPERLATLRTVGVPYTDAQIENAVAGRARPGRPGRRARRGADRALRRSDQRPQLRRSGRRSDRDGRDDRLPAGARPAHRPRDDRRSPGAGRGGGVSAWTIDHDTLVALRQDLRALPADRDVRGRGRLRLLAVEEGRVRPRRAQRARRRGRAHVGRGTRPADRPPDHRSRVERHHRAQHAGAAGGLVGDRHHPRLGARHVDPAADLAARDHLHQGPARHRPARARRGGARGGRALPRAMGDALRRRRPRRYPPGRGADADRVRRGAGALGRQLRGVPRPRGRRRPRLPEPRRRRLALGRRRRGGARDAARRHQRHPSRDAHLRDAGLRRDRHPDARPDPHGRGLRPVALGPRQPGRGRAGGGRDALRRELRQLPRRGRDRRHEPRGAEPDRRLLDLRRRRGDAVPDHP